MRLNLKIATLTLMTMAISAVGVNAKMMHKGYMQTNIVSDLASENATFTDADLVNSWGIAFFPGGPFWINDNASGFSTLYDQTGMLQGTFTIPPPAGSTAAA